MVYVDEKMNKMEVSKKKKNQEIKSIYYYFN